MMLWSTVFNAAKIASSRSDTLDEAGIEASAALENSLYVYI